MNKSWERPKINMPKTKSERVGDLIGYSFYVGSLIFLIIIWSKLPDNIPVHYNTFGEADRWGSKWEILLMPGIGFFILLFMQVFERFPEVHNYPKRFNKTNAAQFYIVSRKMINQIKNICLVIFAFITFYSVATALGWLDGLGVLFLPIVFIGLGLPIVIGIIRFKAIK